jgi:hypothetical protein
MEIVFDAEGVDFVLDIHELFVYLNLRLVSVKRLLNRMMG